MVVLNLQAIGSNLIFKFLTFTTKCPAHALLPKMEELNANIIMWMKLVLPSFFIHMFLLGIGSTLSTERITLSTDCLCMFLTVFYPLKLWMVSLQIMKISTLLVVESILVYENMHPTSLPPTAYRAFFLVMVPHIKVLVVLTLPLLGSISHSMLVWLRLIFLFWVLHLLLLPLTLFFSNFL